MSATDPWDVDSSPVPGAAPGPGPDTTGLSGDAFLAAARHDPDPAESSTASDVPGLAEQFALDVTAEAHRIRVREAAHARITHENAPPPVPFDAGSLDDLLKRPPEPPYRVDQLIPSDAGVLLVAQRKTGKTTWMLNLARCLITEETFLGKFDVRPVTGRVAFLNFEVSSATFAGWAKEAGVRADRLFVVNGRGRRNPFTHPDDRAALAQLLRDQDVEALFVDPFGRAFDGTTQNDAGEVGTWLMQLDAFARAEVGARDLILAAHAGWNGERTRGSSALEDWADVVVTLKSNFENDDPTRYMRAIGRDVDLDEDQLHFDPRDRSLTLTGTGSRKAGRDARAVEVAKKGIRDFVKANPGCSGEVIRKNVDGGNTAVVAARRELVASGELVEEDRAGKGGGRAYRMPDTSDKETTPPTPPNPAQATLGTPPTPSYRRRGSKAALKSEPRQNCEDCDGPLLFIKPGRTRCAQCERINTGRPA